MTETQYHSQKFIFLHQVKTAGKTVEKFLLRKYGDDYCKTTSVFRNETIDNIYSILDSRDNEKIKLMNEKKIIHGHFPYGIDRLVDGDCRYFTLLRDPVDRIRSYYAYSLRNKGSRIYEYLHNHSVTFERFVEMDKDRVRESGVHELNYVLENGQTKIISGQDILVGEPTPSDLAAIADQNIEKHFDFVGVTELFDDSFIQISRILGFGPFSLYITQNRSTVKVDVSEHVRKVILERNLLDSALHKKHYENVQSLSKKPIHKIASAYLRLGSRAANFYVKIRS